jgi:hypothetical protein
MIAEIRFQRRNGVKMGGQIIQKNVGDERDCEIQQQK